MCVRVSVSEYACVGRQAGEQAGVQRGGESEAKEEHAYISASTSSSCRFSSRCVSAPSLSMCRQRTYAAPREKATNNTLRRQCADLTRAHIHTHTYTRIYPPALSALPPYTWKQSRRKTCRIGQKDGGWMDLRRRGSLGGSIKQAEMNSSWV